MSEKRVYAASRTFILFFGSSNAQNQPHNPQNARISFRNAMFRTNLMRIRRIYSAKGAFTLSIDQYRQTFQACRHWRWLPWIGLDAFRIEKAVTRNNAHLITTRHHFYKIGIGSTNTVRLEYNKYRQIALHCQELTRLSLFGSKTGCF